MSEEGLAWKIAVLAKKDGHCWMCPEPAEEAHHIIYQKKLNGAPRWDTRNGIPLCGLHHRRHHNRREVIPFVALPDEVIEFAEEHGLTYNLERTYA